MPPNIVVAAIQAAPDALGAYRKNRVLDRTRKGNDYLFHAVELVDGIREMLDVEAISGFSIRYNGCEELRQLIEQASASTKGVGYVAKRYLQAAEELLEFSKLCVARAKAKAFVRGSYGPSSSFEAGPSTPRLHYTSSPTQSIRSRSPTPDLTPDTDNHSSSSTLDLPRFASPSPTTASHPSAFGDSRSNSLFSHTASRSNSIDRNSFFLSLPRSTTPGRRRLASQPSRALGRLTPSLPGPLAGPTQRTRNVSIRQAPEAIAQACRVLDAKHHFPGPQSPNDVLEQAHGRASVHTLDGRVRTRKDSVHLRDAAIHRPDSAIVDDREEEDKEDEDEESETPRIHIQFPTESTVKDLRMHIREAAAATPSPQQQAASLAPPSLPPAHIHAREAAVHRPFSLAASQSSNTSSSYTTCSASLVNSDTPFAEDVDVHSQHDNHSVRSLGTTASFSTRTHRLSTTALQSAAGDDDDDEGDAWSQASTIAMAPTVLGVDSRTSQLGTNGAGRSAVSIPSIPDEPLGPASPLESDLSVPSSLSRIPNVEDEEEDDAHLPPDTEVSYYRFPFADRTPASQTRSLPMSSRQTRAAPLELVPAPAPSTIGASRHTSRVPSHGPSSSVPNVDEFGSMVTPPPPSWTSSAIRRLASESATAAGRSHTASPRSGFAAISLAGGSSPAIAATLASTPKVSPAEKNRKLPHTPSIREQFLIDGNSVAGSRIGSPTPSTLILGSAGWASSRVQSAAPRSELGWQSRAQSAVPRSEAGWAGVGAGMSGGGSWRSGTPSTVFSGERVQSEALTGVGTVLTSRGSSGSGGTFGVRLTVPGTAPPPAHTPKPTSWRASNHTQAVDEMDDYQTGMDTVPPDDWANDTEQARERKISNTSNVPTIASMPFTPTSPYARHASGAHPRDGRAPSPAPTVTPTIASEGSFGPMYASPAVRAMEMPEMQIVAPVGVRPARIGMGVTGGEAWWASRGVVGV